MKQLRLGKSDLHVSEIGLGCMRMESQTPKAANEIIHNAIDVGVNFFDHADIYGGGLSEEVFAKALREQPSLRDKFYLQTKCGIRDNFFDFSKDHILKSVDGSLKRLNTEHIDVLLLHRPDALMDPEEVAQAFTKLKQSGKVSYFGVSNQNPYQIELLKKYLEDDLIVNQLQFSLAHTPMIDAGLNVNMTNRDSVERGSHTLDYCRLNDMTVQAWSPFQYGLIEGVFVGNKDFPDINAKLQELAEKYNVTDSAIAIAWILRHPAGIQPIVGTMNTQRMQDIAEASNVELTRKEWYELYLASGHVLP